MNRQAVKAEIQNVITEARSHMTPKQIRKQYAPGKAQQQALTDLGIIDLMPEGYGFSDAAAVIRAAREAVSGEVSAYGEGEGTASKLYTLLNEIDPEQPRPYPPTNKYFVMYRITAALQTILNNLPLEGGKTEQVAFDDLFIVIYRTIQSSPLPTLWKITIWNNTKRFDIDIQSDGVKTARWWSRSLWEDVDLFMRGIDAMVAHFAIIV